MEKLFFGYPLEQVWARDGTGQFRDFWTAPDCPVGQSREILYRSRSSRSLLSRDLLSREILVPGLSRRFSRSRLSHGFESRSRSQSRGFAGPGSRQCPGTTAHPCSRIPKNLIEKFCQNRQFHLFRHKWIRQCSILGIQFWLYTSRK